MPNTGLLGNEIVPRIESLVSNEGFLVQEVCLAGGLVKEGLRGNGSQTSNENLLGEGGKPIEGGLLGPGLLGETVWVYPVLG